MTPSRYLRRALVLSVLVLGAVFADDGVPIPHHSPVRLPADTEETLLLQVRTVGAPGALAAPQAAEPRNFAEAAHITERPPLIALAAAFSACLVGVLAVFGQRGAGVVISIALYLTALSTIKLTVKWVFVGFAFPFPQFLSTLHGLTCGVFCLPVLLYRGSQEIVVPSTSEFFLMISPIAVASSISIAANNVALNLCSVAFVMIVASTSCLCTVGMVVLLGMSFDKRLLAPTVGVVIGCAIASIGEINFSLLGMVLCFASNAFRAIRGALQQKLLIGESRDKFDPCALLFWCSFPSVVVTLVGSLIFEGLTPYRRMAALDREAALGLGFAIGISCVNAAALNLANLFMTRHLGAVGAQIVAQARAVLVILGGMAFFSEPVTGLECIGFAIVLVSVAVFGGMEQASKQKETPPPQDAGASPKEISNAAGARASG